MDDTLKPPESADMAERANSHYQKLFWIVVPIILTGSVTGLGFQVWTNATVAASLATLNATVIKLENSMKSDLSAERDSRERLFLDISGRITSMDGRLRSIELELAERRGRGQ